ncbi:RGS domain-containing protein [Coemansia spiralis]|nr:RGS domain-containing protein [Coemansia spiralis]
MTLSLLDPHPIIVPPPGSRLAFAGATSRETAHTFRSLPSLEDTLLRRARAPLCLYNYWQYLLEIECRPEELEFWLSLSDYEVLYRRYANLRSPSIGPIGDGNTQERAHIPTMGPTGKREAKDEALDTPTRDDMRYAVDRLYSYYFSPGAPAQLYISSQMRDEIATRVETDGRLDSDLFAPAKRHAYEAMHNESYLRFLRERLYHNITRGTAAPRIALGLSLIFVALAFQFSLIFLDVTPKGWRWLPLAAMWPGFVYAFAGVSRLDPFMALLGRYEPKAWHFESVQDAAIRDSHLKRGSMQLIFAAAIAAIITLVLFLVPGHHL